MKPTSLIISFLFCFTLYSQTPTIERDALFALFNSTDGPNWVNNTNWNTTAPVSSWFGVTTNSSDSVIALDLNTTNNFSGSNNLTGIILPEISNLQALEVLDLSHNNLTGLIPTEIDNLTQLTDLDLNSNNLSGIIPTNIGNLQNLEYLDLTLNVSPPGQTYVPDDNFEQRLIDLGYDTGALDDYVPTANINTLTYLNVNNKNISDLTGIEDFIALTRLDAYINQITTIDLSQNILLTELAIWDNNLTALDVTQNTLLTNIDCRDNNITNTIDTSQNLMLENFYCGTNQLTSLDLSSNTNLVGLYCSKNQLTNLDVSQNDKLVYLHFFINQISNIDTSQNPLLEELHFGNNTVSTVDISQNTMLYRFRAASNNLTTLNTSQNTNLRELELFNNQITSLDLTQNTLLEYLRVDSNDLTALDVSQNTVMQGLSAINNDISTLNLMPATPTLIGFNVGRNELSENEILTFIGNCNNLTAIGINNNEFSGTIPDLSSYALSLLKFEYNNFEFGDFENQHAAYLPIANYTNTPQAKIDTQETITANEGDNITLTTTCSGTQNTYEWYKGTYPTGTLIIGETNADLNLNPVQATDAGDYYCIVNNNVVTNLALVRNPITLNTLPPVLTYVPDDNFEQRLIDLGYDTGALDDYVPTANINTVISLDLNNQNIADLTGIEDFTALVTLTATNNLLTTVDLSQNTLLTLFYANNNNINTIDLSQNALLRNLILSVNNLATLDITQNPLLETLSANFNQFTNLDVTQNPNLILLSVAQNQIATIDVSQNLLLETLTLSANQISIIDLSQNSNLITLQISSNLLANLDITQNTSIEEVSAGINNLITLDTSQNPVLEILLLGGNQITSLDVTTNTVLKRLRAGFNQLTTVDISQNIILEYFEIDSNQVNTLNLMPPTNTLTTFSVRNNLLSGNLIPNYLGNCPNLEQILLSGNQFNNILPDFTSYPLSVLLIQDNNFEFGDFENQHNFYTTLGIYDNNPQDKIDIVETTNALQGDNVTLTTTCSGTQNTYQWYKGTYPTGTIITGATNADLNLNPVQPTDSGEYYCIVDSNIVTDLTLVRNQITLNVISSACATSDRDALIALYNATDGPNWVNNTNWNTTAPLNTWFGVTTNATGCVTNIDLNTTNNLAGSNNLVGTLPPEIGNLQSLTFLDLFANSLSGSIPDEITNLPNLAHLNLGQNLFTGSIPFNIGNLTNLAYLELSANDIGGDIPMSITNLTNLYYLRMAGNELTGNVPLGITNITSLQYLRLADNNLTGFIYPEYGNLTNLLSFDIEGNNLTGTIPTELGNLINIIDFRIGNQDLTGTIPVSLGNLVNVQTFSLTSTLVTGTIPASFNQFGSIRFLFLSDNELSGNLPDFLGNLTTLEALFLRNNSFSGNVPISFLNLVNLQSLSISNNELEGNIPDLTTLVNLDRLYINNNAFQFGDFEMQHPTYLSYLFYDNNPQANVNTEETITTCDNQSVTLSTTVSGSQNTYQWYKGIYPSGALVPGATAGDLTLPDVQVADAGDYYCEINSTIVTDLTLIRNPIHLNVNSSVAVANPINNISVCDANNDGFESFFLDINAIESQVLNGQSGFNVSYFDTLGNPITLSSPYTNTTANIQTITARVTDTSGCFDETTFDLIVNPTPQVDTITNQIACDNYTLPNITNGDYFTLANGNGTSLNAGDLITTSQTIYIFSEINGCSNESSFSITINQTPTVDTFADEIVCDIFVLPNLTNGNFYTGPNGTGTQLNSGDSITTTQTIYVYNENGSAPNICSSESNFTITVNTTPIVDTLSNETACDNYILQPLTNGNYYTQPNGLGLSLNSGDTITSSQTVYIYNELNGCSAESSFEITINITPLVDTLTDETACDSFTLPVLTDGNYYTQNNGNGIALNSGDQITATQTLFIYSNNNGCTAESSFTITINNTPIVDSINDVSVCGNYILQPLNSGNYYTATNGNGSQLNSGDQINSSQTIYIYNELNGCAAESVFDITINPIIDFTLNPNNIEIDEGEVIVNMLDSSIVYEYSIDGFNYQNSNIFSNLIDGNYTLYVRDENGCIEKSIEFIIELTQFFIPKYFTPNGDNIHEQWVIADNKNAIKLVSIFDRYGKLLTQIKSNTISWDGTFKGKLLRADDYWYLVELNNGSVIKGHFSLVR